MAQTSATSRRSASSELSDAPPPNQPQLNKGGKSSISISDTVRPIQIQQMISSDDIIVAGPSKPAAQKKATNGKSAKQTNGSKPKKAVTVVGRSRTFWGRQAQSKCDYEIEGPIQDDWQVAYVWAFLIRFRRDNVPADAERFDKQNVITELRTVDEFEESLKSEIPDEGLTEVLLVLLRPLWRVAADALEERERKEQAKRKDAKSRHKPSKALTSLREPLNGDNIIDKLSHLIDERLQPGFPLNVFDAYIFSKTEFYENEESAARADQIAEQDANTVEYRQLQETDPMSDRSENNPLKNQGFWTSPWSIKAKILRQLVDWNLSDTDIHDILTQSRAKGKVPTVYDVERSDKGQEGQHWQTVEDTWRIYAIKKPLQIHGSTITAAKTKEEYLELMNRHLAHEAKLPDMRKEKSLAASKNKVLDLRNKIILAERDVEFGKSLQGRIQAIEANFANFDNQREELIRKKARAAERQARENKRAALAIVPTDYSRTTRSRTKVNYAEQNDVDDEEEPSVDYRGRSNRTMNGSDGGDYHSSSIEPEIPTHGRNTRNSRTSALTTGYGYQTRGTTATEFEELGSRAASENGHAEVEDEDQNQNGTDNDDDDMIVIDADEDEDDEDGVSAKQHEHKRRYSEIDQEEEDGPALKRAHLNQDQSSSREGSL